MYLWVRLTWGQLKGDFCFLVTVCVAGDLKASEGVRFHGAPRMRLTDTSAPFASLGWWESIMKYSPSSSYLRSQRPTHFL